jgi:large repetitive protein
VQAWRAGLVAGLMGAVAIATPAEAKKLSCGDVITKDTVLSKNLKNCPNDGIVIGDDNVTLDLDGHTIDGTGGDAGVHVDNHTGVTVRHGTVQQFGDGVLVDNGSGAVLVSRITALRNVDGVTVADSGDVRVEKVLAKANVDAGIRLDSADGNRVSANDVSLGNNFGINLVDSDGNRILDNSARANATAGIRLETSSSNRLERNTAKANFPGIQQVSGNDNRYVRNVAVGNAFEGIRIEAGDGNDLERNTTSENRASGIFVDDDVTATVLLGNQADENDNGTGDGITVEAADAATTITDNSANRNDDLGIDAAVGVTDGGGNTAHNNGNPAECAGVTCS